MDIEALRSLIAFAETGSFTRASLQVRKTQSAISQQMTKLEMHTGKPLFMKKGRNLVLTDDGKLLLAFARQLVALSDDALLQLRQKNSIRPLILGVPDDYVQNILPHVLACIKDIVPDMIFDIRCANSRTLRKQLDAGLIDLAIVTTNNSLDEGYLLTHSSGAWLYNGDTENLHKLLKKPKLPLILYDPSCAFHHMAVNGLAKINKPFNVAIQTMNSSVINSLVRQGFGITCMQAISQDRLTILRNDDVNFNLPILSDVGISLCLSAHPHPYLSSKQLTQVIDLYRDRKKL